MKNEYEIRGDTTAIFLKRRNGELLETLISTNDLSKVTEFQGTWCADYNPYSGGSYYVRGRMKSGKMGSLHRFLIDAAAKYVVDHINHNTLDNRRDNLRAVTVQINSMNHSPNKVRSNTGIRNVSYTQSTGKYIVTFRVNGVNKNFGSFKNIADAQRCAERTRARLNKRYLEAIK